MNMNDHDYEEDGVKFVNLTPHAINVAGEVFEASGVIARVASSIDKVGVVDGFKLFKQTFGEVQGIPGFEPNVFYIVSAMVFSATDRKDVVAPATGHKDVVRENGQIVSVPGFIVK